MQLVYRAQIFNYTPAEPKPYVKPRALNWRFQAPGEVYEGATTVQAYVPPRAMNWRFQMQAGM